MPSVSLNLIGSGLRKQIVFWFLVSAVLSAVLPNAVVCATVTPIAVSMLNYIGEKDVSSSKTASKILLTIAYAAGVGGLATPLGALRTWWCGLYPAAYRGGIHVH